MFSMFQQDYDDYHFHKYISIRFNKYNPCNSIRIKHHAKDCCHGKANVLGFVLGLSLSLSHAMPFKSAFYLYYTPTYIIQMTKIQIYSHPKCVLYSRTKALTNTTYHGYNPFIMTIGIIALFSRNSQDHFGPLSMIIYNKSVSKNCVSVCVCRCGGVWAYTHNA